MFEVKTLKTLKLKPCFPATFTFLGTEMDTLDCKRPNATRYLLELNVFG